MGFPEVYAAISIDAINAKVRDGQVGNRPVYLVIGVNLAGDKAPGALWPEGFPLIDCRWT